MPKFNFLLVPGCSGWKVLKPQTIEIRIGRKDIYKKLSKDCYHYTDAPDQDIDLHYFYGAVGTLLLPEDIIIRGGNMTLYMGSPDSVTMGIWTDKYVQEPKLRNLTFHTTPTQLEKLELEPVQ